MRPLYVTPYTQRGLAMPPHQTILVEWSWYGPRRRYRTTNKILKVLQLLVYVTHTHEYGSFQKENMDTRGSRGLAQRQTGPVRPWQSAWVAWAKHRHQQTLSVPRLNQSISGSCTNASSTATMLSALLRMTCTHACSRRKKQHHAPCDTAFQISIMNSTCSPRYQTKRGTCTVPYEGCRDADIRHFAPYKNRKPEDKQRDVRTIMTFSHVMRKFPSIPATSIALMSILVRRNGTFSGNLERLIATSKQSPKSTCITPPVTRSSIKLDGCRSPRPRMYPTIDITARDRVYAVRRSSHVSESPLCSHITFAMSSPGICDSAWRKISTFWIVVSIS